MELTKIDENNFELSLVEKELSLIKGCTGQCFAFWIEKGFEERFGVSEDDFTRLSAELRELLDKEDIEY